MSSEIEKRTNFDIIRYSQCWEDADILIEGLELKENDIILSVASAGDNSFSLLTKNPKKILAVDLSKAQIACCELRKACYKYLNYEDFIKLSGVLNNSDAIEKAVIYRQIKDNLPEWVQEYFEMNKNYIYSGFMTVGKFENYFRLFRTKILPLVHNRETVDNLLKNKNIRQQVTFYDKKWNNFKWRSMFKIFFSKHVMGKHGRDPEFYKYVEKNCAETILTHAEFALKYINTYTNPYLNYILNGQYFEHCLPHALRKENFEIIKKNIDNIEFKVLSIEDAIINSECNFDAYNLSDIFEYMSEESMKNIYENIINKSNKNARIMYWNMLVDRKCPKDLSEKIEYNKEHCKTLHKKDKAFFYSDLVIEKIK